MSLDEDRLYSNVLDEDATAPKKSVKYFKKVEKTTKTVTKDGGNPRTRIESTTIIK